MTSLSEHNRDIIARHPLNNLLDRLRDLIRGAEESYESHIISYVGAVDRIDQTYQKVISRLLYALQGEEAAFNLCLKTSSRDVASELADLFKRIRNGDFNYQHYRTLSQLVIRKASDIDIWNAVFDLIITISRLTPPSILPLSSVPPTFKGTPISHSSASQQGGEQTRKQVEQRVFEEIQFCTYRGVGGFFQKYFEEKDWTPRTKQIYQSIKDQHANGRWTDIPDSPVQDKVLKWWFQFQDRFVANERGLYDTITTPKDLVGAEARRQIDIFVKRNDRLRNSVRDWKDVTVIGELKTSEDRKKETLLQLGRYVRDVFSCQPTRRYVPAFTICGRIMEVWIFDRSGPYGDAFDIHEEPERFIQVIAGYTMMSDEELGLDTFIKQDIDGRFITLEQDGAEKPTELRMELYPLTRQRAIVCRGTTCVLTRLRPPKTGIVSRNFHGRPTSGGPRWISSGWHVSEALKASPSCSVAIASPALPRCVPD